MEKLISMDKLVEEAKQKGVDFGKGNPYNRLRYYTKIGWLPHMIRKKADGSKTIVGHYPEKALNRLILIEQLKNKGADNDEISKKLDELQKKEHIYSFLLAQDTRNKIILYTSFVLLLIIFANELEIIKLGKPKSQILVQNTDTPSKQIIETGTAIIPANKNQIFVKNSSVNETTKIYVTFNQDFSPATRFWISQKTSGEGFYLSLDTKVTNDTQFSWWITN